MFKQLFGLGKDKHDVRFTRQDMYKTSANNGEEATPRKFHTSMSSRDDALRVNTLFSGAKKQANASSTPTRPINSAEKTPSAPLDFNKIALANVKNTRQQVAFHTTKNKVTSVKKGVTPVKEGVTSVKGEATSAPPKNNTPISAACSHSEPELSAMSVGIFSDSAAVSELIESEVRNYDIKVEHVSHPSNFTPQHFPDFDKVSVWIICLSEEDDCNFLDQFIERYIDKSSLFLLEDMNRLKTTRKIEQFVVDSGLIRMAS